MLRAQFGAERFVNNFYDQSRVKCCQASSIKTRSDEVFANRPPAAPIQGPTNDPPFLSLANLAGANDRKFLSRLP